MFFKIGECSVLCIDLNLDSAGSSCSENFKRLFNSRLEWAESYQKIFMWNIQKVIKDLIVYRPNQNLIVHDLL